MSDLNEDIEVDETTAKIRAQEGYELVLQIPSLLKGMKHLVSEFERIDREIKELSDLPGKVELFGEDIILVKAQMAEIKTHIESIPKLLEVLSLKIDANNKIASETSESFRSQFLEPRDKIKDAYIRWTWKVLNAIALLCALGIAQVLGFGKWAAAIIKAAL